MENNTQTSGMSPSSTAPTAGTNTAANSSANGT